MAGSNSQIRRRMVAHIGAAALFGALLCPAVQAQSDDLPAVDTASSAPSGWSVQLRDQSISGLRLGGLRPLLGSSSRVRWQLLGGAEHLGIAPGLRLTGGLLGLQRPLGLPGLESDTAADASEALPYLGLGWSLRSTPVNAPGAFWRLDADVGVLGVSTRSALRLGRPAGEGRYTPLMQLGLSYGF